MTEKSKPNEIKSIVFAALDLPSEQRAAFLQQELGDDIDSLQRAEALLANADSADSFMASPAVSLMQTTAMESMVVGKQIDRYKLMEQIGEGGMGIVYVAEQIEPVRRMVALKVIKPGMDSKQVIARFEAERQALALMDHPNIAKVLDAGTTNQSLPFFVMELVRGLPITEYCDQAKLSTRERLVLFMAVCNAIQHAHQKGIIHRDIKPNNVMVTLHDGKPVVKVIDFGVAKALHQPLSNGTVYTGLNQVIGTPLYMSPEQIELSGLDIDTRTDVYSLGVLLYELLTGMTPFDRDRLQKSGFDEMRRIIREEVPPRPSLRVTTLPKAALSTIASRRGLDDRAFTKVIDSELDWIVLRSLEKDRNRRFESASEFRADVERYLKDEPVSACPPSYRYQALKWFRRNRVLVTTTGVVILSLLVGLVGTSVQAQRARAAESLAKSRFQAELAARVLADAETDRANQEKRRADAEADRARIASSHALTESAKANAISDFLQRDLLAQVDIHNRLENHLPADRDVSLLTLLDRASQKIEGRFTSMPGVEGSLRYTLAQCYSSLGKHDVAMRHIQHSVEIGRNIIGASHPGTLRAICLQANLTRLQGDLNTAEALLSEAERGIVANGDEASEDGRMLMGAMLVLRFNQGRHEEAIAIGKRLLKLSEETLGATSPLTLTTIANLAVQYSALGDLDTSEDLQRKAYDLRLNTLGPTHPDTISSVKYLAVLCDTRGQYQQSQTLFEQAAERYESLLGADHPVTLDVKSNLGHVLTRQSKLGEAEALLQDTISRFEATLGEKHLSTLDAVGRLASTREKQRRFDETLKLRRRVLEGYVEHLGETHADVISARANYATALRGLKRIEEADENLKQTVEAARLALGPQHPMTLDLLNNLGVSYYDSKEYENALKIFRDLEDVRLAKQGPTCVDLLSVRINIASVLAPLGQQLEAQELLRDTIAKLDSNFGKLHPLAVLARERLAEQLEAVKARSDHYVESILLRRQLVEIHQELVGSDHVNTMSARMRLVNNLVQQANFLDRNGNSARAESLFAKAYADAQTLSPNNSIKLYFLSRFVKTLLQLEKREQAGAMIEQAIQDLQIAGTEDPTAMRRLNGLLESTKMQIASPDAPEPAKPDTNTETDTDIRKDTATSGTSKN